MMSEDASLLSRLAARFQKASTDLIFVHSDILGGFAVPRPTPFDRQAFLRTHFDTIAQLLPQWQLWFPAFNYTFPQSRAFDVLHDRSQVGHLAEFFRSEIASWRTTVPVFSVSGTGSEPKLPQQMPLDAFGTHSIFQQLVDRDGLIFNYGCDLSSLTFVHFCESLAEIPYRYPKRFAGTVTDARHVRSDISVQFHVRPSEAMTYDWKRLEADLKQNGILKTFCEDGRNFQLMQARELSKYWSSQLANDELFLLDEATRAWVEPKLQDLGRAFQIDDFESTEIAKHG